MGQKAKIIFIGLSLLLVICLVGLFSFYNAKENLTKELDSSRKENDSITAQLKKRGEEYKKLEEKLNMVSAELEKVKRESDENRRRFEETDRIRIDLEQRLKNSEEAVRKMEEASKAPQQQVQAPPPGQEEYWAAVLKEKADLQMQLDSVRTELKNSLINNEQLQREKATLELDITNLKRDNEEIKRQFDYNKKIMDTLAVEVIREKNDKSKIEDGAKIIKNENSVLRDQIRSLNNLKVNLERKVVNLSNDKMNLETKLTQFDAMLKERILQTDELSKKLDGDVKGISTRSSSGANPDSAVELPPIVVRPQTGMSSAMDGAYPAGKILAVNRPNNFVIVDIGEDAGVKLGDTFDVSRNGKVVANLEVIQVRRDISACDIKREALPVEIGDLIK